MRVRPITFSAEDIRALQASRKSILHLPLEVVFPQPVEPGDLFWVREAAYISSRHFTNPNSASHPEGRMVGYAVNMDANAVAAATVKLGIKRTAADRMPQFASRFTLIIEATAEISLDQITETEARKAGIWFDGHHYRGGRHSVYGTLNRHRTALDAFRDEWSSMYMDTSYSPHRDPRILRVSFTAAALNVDEVLARQHRSTVLDAEGPTV